MTKILITCCLLLLFYLENSHFILKSLSAQTVALNIKEFSQSFALSNQDQRNLQQGKVVLKGQKGKYVGQVTAKGDLNTAWQVLTDYNNFKNFLPNITASKIISEKKISANTSQVIFEQVNVVDLWLVSQEFTVKIAANNNPNNHQITFQIVDGDLKKLQGAWIIETTSSGKILVKHLVEVEPESNTEKPFFYGVYESSLEDTLQAIAREIDRRYHQTKL